MPKNGLSPKWRTKRFPFPVLTLHVNSPWSTCSNCLKKSIGPEDEFLRYFELNFKKFKKSLRELGAKIQKSVFLDFSNFSYLPVRQTLATYVEDRMSRKFFAPSPERRFGRKFCKFALVQSLRPYISKSTPDRAVKISDFTERLQIVEISVFLHI